MKLRLVMLICVWAMTPTGVFAEVKIGADVVVVGDTNYNALTNNGANALEKEMFDKMKASSEMFSFGTLPKAQDHYKTRKEIVTAIGQMKAGGLIDFSYDQPNPKYPKLNGVELFESMGPRKDPKWVYFKAKAGIKASDALKCIEGGTTRTECITALDSAIQIGHRRALGDAFIDGKIAVGDLKIDKDIGFTYDATDTTTVIPGDFLFMKNKDDYEPITKEKKIVGALWFGENCIYVGGTKYSGLGLQGRTEAEMRGDLNAGYKTDTGITMMNPEIHIRFTTRRRIEIQP